MLAVPGINQENRPFVGILALVIGLFVFSMQDVIIKLFSKEYSILQIVIVRSVIALALIGMIVAIRLGRSGFRVYQQSISRSPHFLCHFHSVEGLLSRQLRFHYHLYCSTKPRHR